MFYSLSLLFYWHILEDFSAEQRFHDKKNLYGSAGTSGGNYSPELGSHFSGSI